MGKIRVEDDGDVDRLLDKYGVESHEDIRRANGSRKHRIARTEDAERLDLHAGGSADQFAANMEALQASRTVLVQQIDAISRTVEQARLLGGKMNDGHGPIASAMSTTFRLRARAGDGVVAALVNYRAELLNVLAAIDNTLVGYDVSDSTSKSRLTPGGEV